MSVVTGPTCRQAMEKREGSSARPRLPLTPPVRAWLMWQATPDTLGSSKALMQTLSLAPRIRKVVLTQDRSSASTGAAEIGTAEIRERTARASLAGTARAGLAG